MHDLVTLGEILLRLAIPSPTRFETAHQLDVQIGGAEANVAAACARLGLRVAWISSLPANQWGELARHELTGHGVDCSFVAMRDHARMGLYFIEYGVSPRPVRVLYDRRDSAFARMTEAEVDWVPVRRARLVHLTGITPALGEGPRALVRRALREAAAFAFDVNYRATLWAPAEARRFLDEVLPGVRYLFLGEGEARAIFNLDGTAEQMLEALARLAPKATVSLQQGEGCSTARGSTGRAGGSRSTWWIRSARATRMSRASSGPCSASASSRRPWRSATPWRRSSVRSGGTSRSSRRATSRRF